MTDSAILDLQALDVEAGQLEHRRAAMPQRAALTEALAEQARQQAEIDKVVAQRAVLGAKQSELEAEAATVGAKAESDEARLYSGEVTGLKDLEVLQHEIAGLRSRQNEIEDGILETMEQGEAVDEVIRDLEAGRASIDESIATLESEIAGEESTIDEQLAVLTQSRVEMLARIDPALVNEYEKRRLSFGAATVVRFNGANCVGCPSTMPAIEIDRMKHLEGDDPADCEECGRIVLH